MRGWMRIMALSALALAPIGEIGDAKAESGGASALATSFQSGLVEVMKTFNGVTADQGGEIVEILVGNEEFVEFGQPLVVIRPAG